MLKKTVSTVTLFLLLISMLTLTLESKVHAQTTYEDGGDLHLISGTGTFSSVSSNLTVNVEPGQSLGGTITIEANNSFPSDAIAPLIGTPSWGNASTSWWLINTWLPVGQSTQIANVNLIAPQQPGTYYLIFAFNGELTGDQVASATNWASGFPDAWGDGYNIAEFNVTQINQAQQNGKALDYWLFAGGNVLVYVPAAAITLVVGTSSQTYSVSFSESGLAQGIQWSVTFNDHTQSSTSNIITFSVPNGVYAFSITPPTGYTASPSQTSGSVTVNGANVAKQITFTVGSREADSWPMFHHDLDHTGYSTSAAPTTNNTIWIYTTPDGADSSPAVVGDFVYVGSIRLVGMSLNPDVYCLNAVTGSQVWTYTTDGSVESSPAVAGGLVYVGSDSGDVYCLNAATGSLVWSYTTGSYVGSSPAVVGGFVYVGSDDGNVYCLNAATGTLVWNYTTGSEVHSSPAVVSGLVYVGSWDDNVYCLNATNGSLVWRYMTGGLVQSSPAVVGGFVYVASSNDTNVYCLNAATGTLVWSYTTGGAVESSPAVVGGFVYVGSDDGNVYCLNAATGSLVWTYTAGGGVESSPAVVGGLVYVGSADGNVYCLDATTGAFVWSYKTANAVYSSPAVVNEVVYVGSMDGNIYAFGSSSSQQSYSVSFSESGLAQGTQWNVTFNGQAQSSTSNSIIFTAPQGVYAFSVTPAGASPASNGLINVEGDTSVALSWGNQPLLSGITEIGLPANTGWSVSYGQLTQTSTSDTILFTFYVRGLYRFSMSSPGYTAEPSPVDVLVPGINTNVIFVTNSNPSHFAAWDPVADSYSTSNPTTPWSGVGNCYGFSSTALLYFMHYKMGNNTYPYFPSQAPRITNSTSDLDLGNSATTTLNNASLAVMFHQVYDPAAWKGGYPSYSNVNKTEEYQSLLGNLTEGLPLIFVLGNATGWYHAVVAWGIGLLENGSYAIAIYDPNYPGTTQVGIYASTTKDFSYDATHGPFDRFAVLNPAMITTSWSTLWWYELTQSSWWFDNWLNCSVTGYYIVVADKMVTVTSGGLTDYFTAAGNSTTLVDNIPGTSGIEEGSMQVYAIPTGVSFSVVDPSSGQSTLLITRVDNASGGLVGHGYLLNATSSQGDLNYTVTPTASGLSISVGNNALNASVTFFYATEQNCSFSQASNIQVGAMQMANFTVSNWQTLNETGIQITPEFPGGALGIMLTLSAVTFVALATVVRRRKNRHLQGMRSS